jgi:GH15 family glucan-1,4-alpha-glucosidase
VAPGPAFANNSDAVHWFSGYRGTDDGLPEGEGAFGICSFWAVECMARGGDLARATATFERLLEYANDVGLYAEEIDPDTGAALGNFPQAFTHVGLINAALTLAEQTRAAARQAVAEPVRMAPFESRI